MSADTSPNTFRFDDEGVPWIGPRSFRWAIQTRDTSQYWEPPLICHLLFIGFWLPFENGWKLSVQWGTGCYCSNYVIHGQTPMTECPNAEIALFAPDGEMFRWPDGDTVVGYCSPVFVLAVIDHLASPNFKGVPCLSELPTKTS